MVSKKKKPQLDQAPSSSASSYSLSNRNGCVYEDIGLVGDTRLLFFVFKGGHFQILNLSLSCQSLVIGT